MIILTDAEKVFQKVQHPLTTKAPEETRNKKIILYTIKAIRSRHLDKGYI
jgi:hypothetical protein